MKDTVEQYLFIGIIGLVASTPQLPLPEVVYIPVDCLLRVNQLTALCFTMRSWLAVESE